MIKSSDIKIYIFKTSRIDFIVSVYIVSDADVEKDDYARFYKAVPKINGPIIHDRILKFSINILDWDETKKEPLTDMIRALFSNNSIGLFYNEFKIFLDVFRLVDTNNSNIEIITKYYK